MNNSPAATEQQTALSNPMPPIIAFDALHPKTGAQLHWEVKELSLTWEKIDALWDCVKEYRSIFSDLTRDDRANFQRLLTSPEVYWLEAYENGELTTLMYVQGLDGSGEATGHMVDLKRDTQRLVPVVRAIAKYLFANFPINRLTAPTADIYFATCRMLRDAGFTKEGVKREVFLLSGKWRDVAIYGLLRNEVNNELSARQNSQGTTTGTD